MIYPDRNNLRNLLRRLRARRQMLLILRGVAIVLSTGAAILLLTGWAAHRYRHNDNALLLLRSGALITFLCTLFFAIVRPLWKRITDVRLARLIEERNPLAEDRLVTALECSSETRDPNISKAILERLEADANQLAGMLNLGNVIRQSRLLMYGGATLASILILAGVLKWGPREISEGVAQLVMPKTLAAGSSANAMSIKVKPGSARVPRSSDQDVLATLVNFDTEIVSFYWRPVGEKGGSKDDWQGQAMEPAKAKSDYRHSIFNIQDSIEYFVEGNGVRSENYKLTVVDLPFVKQLDITLNFPGFSHLPSKTTEDGGDIAALKGTVAGITAHLSGKVRAARIVLADGKKIEMRANGQDFVGDLSVAGNTSYYIELVSVDGETYRGSNEYDVSVLDDLPPTVSFDRPGRDRKATNLEEVFTQAHAEDDYGVVGMDLYFSVNGGEEKKVNLQELQRESARTLIGTHTFFLEELSLKPGDFISYYAKARDANNETTSDIYFIEVKPFEMEYRQSQQQGGGGGGGGQGGDQDQNALSRRQKDLIAATHKLIRESDKYTPQEKKDGYEAVAAGQEKLRTDTLEFLDRIGRRLPDELEGQKEMAEMANDLKQAAEEMKGAPPPLRQETGRDALPPEQRALQKLLAADAIFRQVQVALGNQNAQGGGGGNQRQQQELAGLFELELDKMKNQYETVQRQQQQQAQLQKSEAERKLEELARRQEQALEEQRRRMQGARNQSGGGGNQRQQQELIDETRKAARELERLSRERRDPQMAELSRQLNQTADEMQKAQAAARGNNNDSIAQNERALDQLREAQNRLQQSSGQTGRQSGASGRQQQVSDLRQRAAQAASRQREIANEVESLARRGGQDANSQKQRLQLAERKDALADSVSGLQQDIEQSARAMGGGQQRTQRQLNDAAQGMARDRIAERIREGKQALNGNNLEGARANERALERSLNNLSERLQSAEQGAGQSGNNAEEALDRTRQLADNVDSLRRRLDENANRRNGNSQGQKGQQGQEGQPQGSQRGQQGQQGQQGNQGQQGQQGNQQNGSNSGGGRQGGANDRAGGYGGWDDRQLNSELRQRLSDAEDLRRQLGGASGPNLGRVIDELRRMTEVGAGHDIETAAKLKDSVIDPLRELELQLSKQTQNQAGRTNLRLRDEGAAPERYRKAVEEYYRRLSGGGRKQQ
jgi:hypothetical protein